MCGGAVFATSISEQFCSILKSFAKQGAAEIDIGCGYIAAYDAGTLTAGCIGGVAGVVGAVGLCVCGVVEGGCFSEADGELAQVVVYFEDFGAVDALGVFGWVCASLGYVSVFCQLVFEMLGRVFAYPVVKLSGISRASNSYCNATWTA